MNLEIVQRGIAAVFLFGLSAAQVANATVTVREGMSYEPIGVTVQQFAGKWRINIVRAPVPPILLNIEGDANDTIEWIRVTNNGTDSSSDIWLIIGPVPNTLGIGTVEEIRKLGGNNDKPVSVIGMDINGDLGRVSGGSTTGAQVDRFQDVIIRGDVLSRISMRFTTFGLQPDNLTIVGDVRAVITNDYGPIGDLVIAGGLLGAAPPAPPVYIQSSQRIDSIVVGSMHNATIGHPNTDPSYLDEISFLGVVNSVTTDGFGEGGTPGILAQSIGTVLIGGNFGCVLRVDGGLVNDPNARSVEIGGSLLSGASIVLPDSGLKSQVIINADDDSGTWQGKVFVGGTELTPLPAYAEASQILGDGAVGEARFRLHSSNCWPFSGETVARDSAPTTNNPIKMRHYGPVWFDSAGPRPFRVMRSAGALSGAWSDETDCFTMSVDSANKTIVSLYPNLGDDTPIQGGFIYSVSLAVNGSTGENVLRCDLAETLRPEVAHYDPISFYVEECMGDADNNGMVNFDDTLSVLANWGSTLCLKYGDADRNGLVNYDDILHVLANFGHDCTMIEFAGGGGGGIEEAAEALASVLEAMGFESLGDFFTAFESADKSTRDEMIQTLGELLGGKK